MQERENVGYRHCDAELSKTKVYTTADEKCKI